MVDVGSDIVYFFDMYLQFCMPRWIKGQLAISKRILMADYLRFRVTSFCTDLVFSFSFDLIFIAITDDRSTAACIRLMRLYRLLYPPPSQDLHSFPLYAFKMACSGYLILLFENHCSFVNLSFPSTTVKSIRYLDKLRKTSL